MYNVFLVDDDEIILDELIRIVPWMDNGFEVKGSDTNSTDAAEKIRALKPDVVFLDLKMPGMDGIELMRMLKSEGCSSEFVMVSAYNDFDNVRSFFQQEGFDYILKPVIIEDIQIVLERLQNRLSSKITKGKDMNTDNPVFNEMVEYVRSHFAEKITLDMLSSKYSFSKNYICNMFSKYLNTSLTCYLTNLRMEYAMNMLRDKSRLIKDVAIESGYSDYYHFFKVFKQYYGVSPKEMQDYGVNDQ